MVIKNEQEFKYLASLVSSTQAEYVRKGMSQSPARKQAATDVSFLCTPPVTAAELESALAVYRNANFDKEYEYEEGADTSIVQTYKTWAMNNDHVTKDAELAHFSGNTRGSFGAARSWLQRKYGFIFTKDVNGWSIVSPEPEPEEEEKKYTESEMMAKFAEFLKSQK